MEPSTNQIGAVHCGLAHEQLGAAGYRPEAKPDRRGKPRFEIDAPATLLLVGDGATVQARISDLSQEGCRLRARQRFAAGGQFRVEVTFRVNGLTFRLGGVTQWTNGWNLVGIRFTGMADWRAADLAEVIAEVQADCLARAAKLGDSDSATRASDGPGYSDAAPTRQFTETDARPKPFEDHSLIRSAIHAVPDDLNPRPLQQRSDRSASDVIDGVDRRLQIRQVLDTFASIILVPNGCRLSGWILDISFSGCRIRTDARFPAGVYTRVEATFLVEGLAFRLAGVVQTIYDRRLVGIQFSELSERKSTQLQQLIAEIGARRARSHNFISAHPLPVHLSQAQGVQIRPTP